MSDTGFKLKDFGGLFTPTDPANRPKGDGVQNLPIDTLIPFKAHPFKLYDGQRFDDMVESIKQSGVIVPIIVRLADDTTYEILSGHNRVEAAKTAGLDSIPAIIRNGLSDEDALLIVTETNLIQRSFADMSHSERAVTLSMHHDAIKKQGKRTDLINEIESMVNASNINDFDTCTPVGNKLKTIEKIGQDYGLAKNSVARYLRVNMLNQAHKDRLDNNELSIRAAVTLSYLTEDEQQMVDDVLTSGNFKLDMKKADALRQLSEKAKLTDETAEDVFTGKKTVKKVPQSTAFKLKPKIVSKYFRPEQKASEIEATIIEALEYFYAHNKQKGDDAPNGDGIIPDEKAKAGGAESNSG